MSQKAAAQPSRLKSLQIAAIRKPALGERECKHCNCTYFTPCIMNGEGCAWVSKDECSACVSPFTGKPYRKTLEAKKQKEGKAV